MKLMRRLQSSSRRRVAFHLRSRQDADRGTVAVTSERMWQSGSGTQLRDVELEYKPGLAA
jgi:hypothetical protein